MSKKLHYTEEFKKGAVKLVLDEGLTQAEVGRRSGTSGKNVSCRLLDVNRNYYYAWVKK